MRTPRQYSRPRRACSLTAVLEDPAAPRPAPQQGRASSVRPQVVPIVRLVDEALPPKPEPLGLAITSRVPRSAIPKRRASQSPAPQGRARSLASPPTPHELALGQARRGFTPSGGPQQLEARGAVSAPSLGAAGVRGAASASDPPAAASETGVEGDLVTGGDGPPARTPASLTPGRYLGPDEYTQAGYSFSNYPSHGIYQLEEQAINRGMVEFHEDGAATNTPYGNTLGDIYSTKNPKAPAPVLRNPAPVQKAAAPAQGRGLQFTPRPGVPAGPDGVPLRDDDSSSVGTESDYSVTSSSAQQYGISTRCDPRAALRAEGWEPSDDSDSESSRRSTPGGPSSASGVTRAQATRVNPIAAATVGPLAKAAPKAARAAAAPGSGHADAGARAAGTRSAPFRLPPAPEPRRGRHSR